MISKKALRAAAATIATAGVASAAMTAPALAAPNDPINVSDASNTFQFGTSCAPGARPGADGNVDWRENAAGTSVAPLLTGDLCLQNTTAEARVVIEYRDSSHAVIGRYASNPATGNGSALNTFAVSRGGPRLLTSAMDHIHIQLQQRVAGAWQDVPGAFQPVSYP